MLDFVSSISTGHLGKVWYGATVSLLSVRIWVCYKFPTQYAAFALRMNMVHLGINVIGYSCQVLSPYEFRLKESMNSRQGKFSDYSSLIRGSAKDGTRII